ncbi:MAG: ABC transporter ATP-binding protein [Phycisphaerales bacterium]
MSSDHAADSVTPVIRATDLGKCYHLYRRPQDRLKQSLWGYRLGKQYFREFWALKGVSFELGRGESLGIIGRNGAGKSTLLQIIAGTLSATEGEVAANGRIAALLELGSGFNPEFTGRDNVFLNGLILGVSRSEMQNRFDDIVAFADIGEFIDQPLKTYSSGMRARLAFAVSTAIEPDVLILDEILSVGDVGFRQKCTARMKRMREDGLTLLFVSHSPGAVRSICDRSLFLHGGEIIDLGATDSVIDRYLRFMREADNDRNLDRRKELGDRVPFKSHVAGKLRYGSGHVQIESIRVLNPSGEPVSEIEFGDEIIVELEVRSHVEVDHLSVSFLVRDHFGVDLLGTTTFDENVTLPPLKKDEAFTLRFSFENRLNRGQYGISVALTSFPPERRQERVLFDQIDGGAAFRVLPKDDRPVLYKFHQPISIDWEVRTTNG